MSVTSDKNFITSSQVKKQLKSIQTDKPDIKHRLLKLIEQFQCLDHIAESIGLVKEGFSFISRVSWKTVITNLENKESTSEDIKLKDIVETISKSTEQLENELVPELQKLRNNWMFDVILIEFVLLGLLTLIIAGVTHIQGLWSWSNFSISIQPFLYERPVFSLLVVVLLLVSFVILHFKIRGFVAKQIVSKINQTSSEFDLAGAFLKNTRIQHSIFRPDIIGWNWLSRKCLSKI